MMKKETIMTDLEILYQEDYLQYEEFFLKDLAFDSKLGTILFISAIGGSTFKDFHSGFYLEEFIQNGTDRLLREEIFVSKDNKCYRVVVYFNKNGIKKYKNIYESSIEEILEECKKHLGNATEIIRLLYLEGKYLEANGLEEKYQYFLANRNRIPEIKERIIRENEKYVKRWTK